jgi:hypothetical protein
MRLSTHEAEKCTALLDGIDMYVLDHYNTIKEDTIILDDTVLGIRLKARTYWQNNQHIVNDYISSNKKLSPDDIEIIQKWRNVEREIYVLVKHYPEYSVFLSTKNQAVYGVLALTDDFSDVIPSKLPVFLETSLLPYKGQIVWDGIAAFFTCTVKQEVLDLFYKECETRKLNGTIITNLEPIEADTGAQASPLDPVQKLILYCEQKRKEYPADIIDQIIQDKETAVPLLLTIAEQFVKHPPFEATGNNDPWLIGILSFILLAKFKEKKAFPLLIKLCELPQHASQDLLGDVLTEHFPALLASTFDGNLQDLNQIVTNQYLNEYARGAAIGAHMILYKYEILTREQFIKILREWFGLFVYDYSYIPSRLVDCCCQVHATELMPEVESYFQKDLIEPMYTNKKIIDKQFALPREEALKGLQKDTHLTYIDNCQEWMSWLFRNNGDDDEQEYADDCDDDSAGYTINCYPEYNKKHSDPQITPAKKVGANQPCPCGSGKKYKKCCKDVVFF